MNKFLTSSDFNKPQPNKSEKLFFILSKQLEDTNRMIALLQKQILAIARITKISDKDLAEAFHDDAANKAYFTNVGTEEKILAKKEQEDNKMKDEKLKEFIPHDGNINPTA